VPPGRISLEDPRLAPFRDIGDAELRRQRGECLVEGRLVVRRLLTECPGRARAVLVTEAARASLDDVLPESAPFPIYVVPAVAMEAITGFNLHRGCLAIASRGAPTEWRDIAARARRLLVLEGVGNPDNIGGLFRTGRAFGVDAVLFGPGSGDPLYRKAIRVSCGASLVVPFAEIAPWPEGLADLSHDGVTVWALTPAADAATLAEVCAAGVPGRLALLLGAEGPGLTQPAEALATRRVRIPIAPAADSLNVVVAAGVALAAVS
jgi:tRNA G18 (ribose-2'-O)-methylase SpoU